MPVPRKWARTAPLRWKRWKISERSPSSIRTVRSAKTFSAAIATPSTPNHASITASPAKVVGSIPASNLPRTASGVSV